VYCIKLAEKLGSALDYNGPAKKQEVETREENKERRLEKMDGILRKEKQLCGVTGLVPFSP
jgi:hypothetical protein